MEVVVAISEYINQIMLVNGGNCDNIKIIPQTFVLPYFMQQKFMIKGVKNVTYHSLF